MSSNPNQSATAYHYDSSAAGVRATRRSASVIVPMLLELARPASVVDVGCGLGDWLAEFRRLGCSQVLGLDGAWVPREHLQIPLADFRVQELGTPLPTFGKFDLATSFEVAEHVIESAGTELVRFLTDTANLVAFSAAVPGQGGYMHVNERWQSHWITKFAARGYSAYDVIRPRIWANENCCWWYRQNLLLFATDAEAARLNLQKQPFFADAVHPRLYEWHMNPANWSGRTMARMFASKLLPRLRPAN